MLIATRQLSVRVEDDDVALEVRLFKPISENGAWSCPYEIDWPSGTRRSRAVGADAVQAILLAFQKIGTELYMSDYHKNGQLSRAHASSGYGFPVPRNVRDILVGEDLDL
jgi:hypothetical protein